MSLVVHTVMRNCCHKCVGSMLQLAKTKHMMRVCVCVRFSSRLVRAASVSVTTSWRFPQQEHEILPTGECTSDKQTLSLTWRVRRSQLHQSEMWTWGAQTHIHSHNMSNNLCCWCIIVEPRAAALTASRLWVLLDWTEDALWYLLSGGAGTRCAASSDQPA